MDDPAIMVAVISLVGTITGSITGVLVSNKLSNYRIEQLEKKIDKYATNVDDLRERLVIVEQSTKSAHHRLDDLMTGLSQSGNKK
jgi:chemotaxis regulatin CheY-phosphate phosphatase CheZ